MRIYNLKIKIMIIILFCSILLLGNFAPSFSQQNPVYKCQPNKFKSQCLYSKIQENRQIHDESILQVFKTESLHDKKVNSITTLKAAKHIRISPPTNYFRKVHTNLNYLSMTFDDCPAGHIEDILDVLKKYNMRATFFVMGVYVKKYPEVTKRIIEEGHTIANHTYDHKLITYLSDKHIKWEIRYTEDLVFNTTGKRTALFRPPGGAISDHEIELISNMGYDIVMWSVDTRDWVSVKRAIVIAKTAGPGDIVLFHTKASTGKAIEEICKHYLENDLRSVPLEELFALAEVEKSNVRELRNLDFFID